MLTAGKTAKEFLMKRNRIIALAVVVMMVVGALVLMSCSLCPRGSSDCYIGYGSTVARTRYCSDSGCAVNVNYWAWTYGPASCDC